MLHSDHCAKKLLPWFDGMLKADEAYFAQHNEPLFSSHMLDLSEESKEDNIATCVAYFKRMAPLGLWLEMEIGITGGEEDGVDNTGVDNSRLYTQPEDIYDVYTALSAIGPNFSIAAAFGNVHGVYKPGNVRLHPELLQKHQLYAEGKVGAKKPLFLVFHGGSGSTKDEIRTAVQNGVVKMNVDTDTQWAYLSGVRVRAQRLRPIVACTHAAHPGLRPNQVRLPPDPGRQPRGRGQAQQEGAPPPRGRSPAARSPSHSTTTRASGSARARRRSSPASRRRVRTSATPVSPSPVPSVWPPLTGGCIPDVL